jgi:hypothetical protein
MNSPPANSSVILAALLSDTALLLTMCWPTSNVAGLIGII